MGIFMSLNEFNCDVWEGGGRFVTGNCESCSTGYDLNINGNCKATPSNCDTHFQGAEWFFPGLYCSACSSGYTKVGELYPYCEAIACASGYSYDTTLATCARNCENGVLSADGQTCTCDDYWKTLQTLGCYCDPATPVEGTSSCYAPDTSLIVVQHTTSVDVFGFSDDYSSDTSIAFYDYDFSSYEPQCSSFSAINSAGKYVCYDPYCWYSSYYLTIDTDGELYCAYSSTKTISSNQVTDCNSSTYGIMLIMELEGGKFLTSCHSSSDYSLVYDSEILSYKITMTSYPTHYVQWTYGTSVTTLGIDCSTYGCLIESTYSWGI